jgi:hypothetical protein
MKTISPIQSWINGKSVTATIFNMYVIGGVLGSSASFYYSLLDSDLINVAQGNLTMSGEAYAAWGNDDEYAWDWAASSDQLNLTIIGDYVPPVPEPIVPTEPNEPLNSILADLRQDAPIDEILGEMN